MGRAFVGLGIAFLMTGLLMIFVPSIRLGRMPGDISFNYGHMRVFIPIGTSIFLSLLLTLVFSIMDRLR